MKNLLIALLTLCAISASANTKTIECVTYYQDQMDIDVDIVIETEVRKNGEGDYTLAQTSLDLKIDGGDWYDFVGFTQEEDHNSKNYKPRKYKGHLKFGNFTHTMTGMEGDRPAPYGLFGYIDFLIPQVDLDNANQGDEFKAVTILSWIADHWGGSRTLNCTVK